MVDKTVVRTIVLFKNQPTGDNGGAAGLYYHDEGEVWLDYQSADALPHEIIGHGLDFALCKEPDADPNLDALKQHQPVNTKGEDASAFIGKYRDEVEDIMFGSPRDGAIHTNYDQALCTVDKNHTVEANAVNTATWYHTNIKEEKAEILESLINGTNFNAIFDRCKKVMSDQTTYLLARIHHVFPKTTEMLIRRSYNYTGTRVEPTPKSYQTLEEMLSIQGGKSRSYK